MSELAKKLAGLSNIHSEIAKDAGIDGQRKVIRDDCGSEEFVDGAWALKNGWPECCGQTMRLL